MCEYDGQIDFVWISVPQHDISFPSYIIYHFFSLMSLMSLGIFFSFVEEFSSLDLAYCRKIFKLMQLENVCCVC